MVYELVTLGASLPKMPGVDRAARDWIADAATGTVLGTWRTEIGTLGRVLVLRRFESAEALATERHRALLDPNAFGGPDVIETLDLESYEAFPFLPSVDRIRPGQVFEFRTYWLKPGGLPPTLAAWEAAIGPAKDYTEHLVVNLYALDGRPRITHLWSFDSLEQRAELRGRHYAAGLWPPKGGPEQIAEAVSTIALPNGEARAARP